jgi:hypothetical protein
MAVPTLDGVQDAQGFGDDLGTDAVTGQDRDVRFHAGRRAS